MTYGSENEDSIIWGVLSDKELTIPIRFTKQAIAQYNLYVFIIPPAQHHCDTKGLRLSNKRLTQHGTALIFIKHFKPFFARVPLGSNKGMSAHPRLAMECEEFSIIGASGEGVFGNPRVVESNEDLRMWSEGLRQHGGAG